MNKYMEDHKMKKKLIRRLLTLEDIKHTKKNKKNKKKKLKKGKYPDANDPMNPENEIDFKAAYKKLIEKLSEDSNNLLLNKADLKDIYDEETVVFIKITRKGRRSKSLNKEFKNMQINHIQRKSF